MNLDIILIWYTMTDVTISMITATIGAVTSIYTTHRYSTVLDRVESCADSFVLSGHNDSNRDRAFVKCMQGNFPHRFAEAYAKKLKSDAKLKDLTTEDYQ